MKRRPIFLAAIAAAAMATAAHAVDAGDAGKVETLIAQSRAALGGEAVGRRGVLTITAKVAAGGLGGSETAFHEMGGLRYAETGQLGPFTQADGFDGQVLWNRDGSGLTWVDGGEADRAESISQAFVDNYALWAPGRGGARVAWGGARSDGGVTYEALAITAPGSALPFELWFDAKTHLPARFVQPIGPKSQIQTYADWRPAVGGLMLPWKTRSTDLQDNVTDVAVVSVAPAPDDRGLAKPASNVHDFSIAGGRAQTAIPFELIDNHVYLSVTLNGKGPYRFIFDTGGANVVDPAVAQEIGAAGQGSFQGGGAGAATASMSFANVATLGVGEAVVKDQLFAVAPVRQGFGVAAGEKVDGLIGFEVLSRFVTTFDYGARRVVLAMPGAAVPAGGETLPFVFHERQPQFACAIDSIPTQCTLDTGARDSVGFYGPFVTAHPQIKPAGLSALGVSGFGFGGPSFGRLGRVDSFAIGGFTLPGMVGDFTADEGGAFAAPFVAANIGGGVWRRFALTLDYGRQTMTLVPNADFAARDDTEHAGLFLVERGGKHLILDVRPGAPAAEAGVVKGDVLDSIDGAPAATLNLRQVRERFRGPAGQKVTLGLVGKDGAKRQVVLTLKPYV